MMNYLNLSQHSLAVVLGPSHLRFVLLLVLLGFSTIVSSADIGKYFTRSPQSIVAPPGDRVTFQCETNIPSEQVRWKLNGRFLHPANETDIRVQGSHLVVKVSKNRDRYVQQVGDYQCVVEFGAEARGQSGKRQVAVALTSVPAQLSIAQIEGVPENKKNGTLEVVEGNTVAIECDAPYSNPPPYIQFYRDGQFIESETGNAVVSDSGILHLQNVSAADTGSYGCTATNHITSDTIIAGWTRLNVISSASAQRKAPEFLLKPKAYSVVPQDANVTLECVAVGNPPPFITWRKLRAPSKVNYPKSSKGNLHLFNIGFSQEGEYICEAYNGVSSLTTLSTIVLNSLPNITKEPANLVVEEGGEAILDCSTEGLPKPRVYWVFNGENVHENGNIQITETGLKIANVEKKHAGLFQCFATNPMGTVTSPAELKVMPKQVTAMASDSRAEVEDKPSSITPPVTRHFHHHKNNKFHRGKHNKRKHKGQDMIPPSKPIMNRISDESVMVRWTVPPNSGYPIQFFKIQHKEVSKRNSRWMTIEEDIPPHIHSYEIHGFRVGHAYRFRIAAVYSNNDNKVGPNSDKFVLTKDTSMRRPTLAPIIGSVSPNSNTSVILRWKYVRTEAGGLDGYFIYFRESTTADEYLKMTVVGSGTDSAIINYLKPGTSYDIKIQAFNKAGASNFSSIVTAKTLGAPNIDKLDDDLIHKKEVDLVLSEEDLPPPSDHLYVLLGCIFAGFWIFLCIACALCYKCKQKKAEEDAKYPCESPSDVEAKGIPSAHIGINGHSRNGYIPTIAAHLELDEKETSFVERHNNNRPISPSQLNSTVCDLGTFNLAPVPMDTKSWTELKPMRADNQMFPNSNSRNSSLQRKKHHHVVANGGSLRRGNYTSCSSEDLDIEPGDANSKDTRIFPKEHYKSSRRHSLSRKRNSMVDG